MRDYIYLYNNIFESLQELYEKDKYLISHGSGSNYEHVSEMSIVFRFGLYLNRRIESWLAENGYSLDIEYNRNRDEIKYLDYTTSGKSNRVRPDMIIHERGSNQNNILVIEFKTWWDKNVSTDRNRLEAFVTPQKYSYRFGLSILIDKQEPRLEWIYPSLMDE